MRDLIDGYRGDISTELDEAEIQQRILNAVAAEANLILDKQIVGSRYDIDLCIVNGFSFPKHRGGILYWQQASAG